MNNTLSIIHYNYYLGLVLIIRTQLTSTDGSFSGPRLAAKTRGRQSSRDQFMPFSACVHDRLVEQVPAWVAANNFCVLWRCQRGTPYRYNMVN